MTVSDFETLNTWLAIDNAPYLILHSVVKWNKNFCMEVYENKILVCSITRIHDYICSKYPIKQCFTVVQCGILWCSVVYCVYCGLMWCTVV